MLQKRYCKVIEVADISLHFDPLQHYFIRNITVLLQNSVIVPVSFN